MAIQTNIMSAGAPLVAAAANQGAQQKNRIREAATTAGTQAAAQERNIQAQQGMETEKLAAEKANTDAIMEDNRRGQRENRAHAETMHGLEGSLRTELQKQSEEHAVAMNNNLIKQMEKNRRSSMIQWTQSGLLNLYNQNEMRSLILHHAERMGTKQTTFQDLADNQLTKLRESQGAHSYVTSATNKLNLTRESNPKLRLDSDFYKNGTYEEHQLSRPTMGPSMGFPSMRQVDMVNVEVPANTKITRKDAGREFTKNYSAFIEDSLRQELGLEIQDTEDAAGPQMVEMKLLDDPKGIALAGLIDGRAVDPFDILKMAITNDVQLNDMRTYKKPDGTFDEPEHRDLYNQAVQRDLTLLNLYNHKTAGAIVRYALDRKNQKTLADATAETQKALGYSAEENMENITKVKNLTNPDMFAQSYFDMLGVEFPDAVPEAREWWSRINTKMKGLHEGAGASTDYDTALGPLGPVPEEPSTGLKFY